MASVRVLPKNGWTRRASKRSARQLSVGVRAGLPTMAQPRRKTKWSRQRAEQRSAFDIYRGWAEIVGAEAG